MFEIIPMTVEHIDGVLAVEEATFSIPWTRKDFEREMTENNLAIYYVAVADGKIVGYAGMWHVITEGHITNVAVLEDYRKQGIGDALMAQLEQVAMEKEMIGITWRCVSATPLPSICTINMVTVSKVCGKIITPIPTRTQSLCGNIRLFMKGRKIDF